MRVETKKSREFNDGTIQIIANENSAKDKSHMERVAAYLVENEGYEEIACDGDNDVILGTASDTVAEAKKAYSYAKKATR